MVLVAAVCCLGHVKNYDWLIDWLISFTCESGPFADRRGVVRPLRPPWLRAWGYCFLVIHVIGHRSVTNPTSKTKRMGKVRWRHATTHLAAWNSAKSRSAYRRVGSVTSSSSSAGAFDLRIPNSFAFHKVAQPHTSGEVVTVCAILLDANSGTRLPMFFIQIGLYLTQISKN